MGGDDGSKDLTTAWICIVIGFLCCFIVTIVGIVMANNAKNKGNPGGQAAFITGIVLLVLSFASSIFWFTSGPGWFL